MALVEPVEKVRQALGKALGLEEARFLERTNVKREDVEKWLRGEGWVPVRVVNVACEINKKAGMEPSNLSQVLEGLTVVVRAPSEQALVSPKPVEVKLETLEPLRREIERDQIRHARTFLQLLIKGSILITSMLISSFVGYLVGSQLGTVYAGLGLFLPIIIFLAILLFWGIRIRASSR